MQHPRIAIVGAGPGGLVLARILHLHGIEAVVFERDEHPHARTQGGSLDMHAETGQFALRLAGLADEFASIARYEDQETRIYDKHGTLQFESLDTAGDRPEVDRTQLRNVLLGSLPEGAVRWNCEVRSAQPNADGFALTFSDGTQQTFDLVVGADGAWSRLRPLLTDVRPVYSGVTFVELDFEDADERFPELAALFGHGMIFALGDSKAILGHRDAGDRLGAYAGLKVPEDWATDGGLDVSSTAATRHDLAAHFDDWAPIFLRLIHECHEPLIPRRIYALPIGHRWEHRAGITLIGDAAHLMSPFSGEGANLAMRDAADLAIALATSDDWDRAIRAFETAMFDRASDAAVGARDGIDETFSDRGLEHVLDHMREIQAAGDAGAAGVTGVTGAS